MSGGRKTIVVKVPELPGPSQRDLGKMYLIEEWSAARAENWGLRMAAALTRSDLGLPMSLAGIGMEGIAIIGINRILHGSINPDVVIPLFDELLECVKIIRDPKRPDFAQAIIVDDDIEEVATRLWLRSEVLKLHTNFSPAAAISGLWRMITTKVETLQTT